MAARLRRNRNLARQAGIENTHGPRRTSAPFFVAPKLSTSTPARQDSSAAEQPTNDRALAKRDPSMCSRGRGDGRCGDRRNLDRVVDRAASGGLADATAAGWGWWTTP